MSVWNREMICKMANSGKLTKTLLREYTKSMIYYLEKKATEKDYYIGSECLYGIMVEIAEELGYKYVKKRCCICGKEVYVLNVKTKAKIICFDCAVTPIETIGG